MTSLAQKVGGISSDCRTRINTEKTALLHASNLAFDKGFSLEQHLAGVWVNTPESTRHKWRKRAEIFGKIVDAEVMEYE